MSKIAGPLMKVALLLGKHILARLGATTAATAIDAGIQKKINHSEITTLIISNEKMNDIKKIVKTFENSGVLLKGVTKSIESKTKKQKGGFLSNIIRQFRL